MIPYGKQDITDEDIAAVTAALKSDFLTSGPTVPEFEKSIIDYCLVDYAVACNSATSALHIACLAINLGPGDIAWTVPNSFVASANCALYCGASIDFVDINAKTLNIDLDCLIAKLEKARDKNLLPKVLICVHFGGSPCDMAEIKNLSKIYGFRIIEDASHAIGAKYRNGMKVGSCEYSDISIFSFHPVKIITTGEGGVATTNDSVLAANMSLLRAHGITRDINSMESKSDGDWYYQQISLGLNYRMTDIHAALGISQMKRLDTYIEQRKKLAYRYGQILGDLPIKFQQMDIERSSLHLYPVIFENSRIRKKVFDFMRSKDIGVNVHYIPIHTQPFYIKMGFSIGDFPAAEDYYSKAISIPIFGSLNFEDQDKIISLLKKSLS
jgi:UDP-4-amino-4,6-dideoxy-N-acetyl-beta-L-altrosamine transaminase